MTSMREQCLERRIAALEKLLAYYRIGGTPPENALAELDRTRQALPDLYPPPPRLTGDVDDAD